MKPAKQLNGMYEVLNLLWAYMETTGQSLLLCEGSMCSTMEIQIWMKFLYCYFAAK